MRIAVVIFSSVLAFSCSAPSGESATTATATSAPQLEALPDGWIRAGSAPDSYTAGLDKVNLHGGAPLALASKADASPSEFGTVLARTDATPCRGKRVRIRTFVRAEAVSGWAGVWMRVDESPGKVLAFDNMQTRPIRATLDWTQYDVVLDVEPSATKISYGVLLEGHGGVWFDAMKPEVVDPSTPITTSTSTKFEAGTTRGLPSKWFLAGNASSSYVASGDTVVHHGGATSISLASSGLPPANGFGTVMQNAIVEDAMRGGRVRLSAYVKVDDVRGGAGLWMRIDGPPGTKSLAFDNMHDRPIKGTADWAPYSVVLDVPSEARNIALGVLLGGEGHVWIDDVVLERVP